MVNELEKNRFRKKSNNNIDVIRNTKSMQSIRQIALKSMVVIWTRNCLMQGRLKGRLEQTYNGYVVQEGRKFKRFKRLHTNIVT